MDIGLLIMLFSITTGLCVCASKLERIIDVLEKRNKIEEKKYKWDNK